MHRISMKRPKICAKHIKSVYKRLFAFFDCGEYSTNWNWFTAFCVSHVKCSRIVHTAENIFKMNIFMNTRSYAALWAADLVWIVGPGYSLGGYIFEKNHENQSKTMKNHEKPTWNH